MKKNQWAIIIGVAAVVILLVLLLFQNTSQSTVNWYSNFREDDDQPYGLHVMSQLLDNYFPEKKYTVVHESLKTVLPKDSSDSASYVFIGERLYLDDDNLTELMSFVKNGNDAFISAEDFPYNLLQKLYFDEYYYGNNVEYVEDLSVKLNFIHPQLKDNLGYQIGFISEWENMNHDWMYFDDSLLVDSVLNVARLGIFDNNYVNFIRVPWGEGNFYLHTTPLIFTNYQLQKEHNLEYVDKTFSHLSASNIYWDEFDKVPQYHNKIGSNETPLRYILSQTSLRWGWYVMLAMVLLFLLFRVKRDQRIIPVLEKNTNTSLEFIQTISRLYFLQNDHRRLAQQKMKLFLGYIRMRYNIQTKELDDGFVQKLSDKSQTKTTVIKSILDHYRTIENMSDIDHNELQNFHRELEEFYQTCK